MTSQKCKRPDLLVEIRSVVIRGMIYALPPPHPPPPPVWFRTMVLILPWYSWEKSRECAVRNARKSLFVKADGSYLDCNVHRGNWLHTQTYRVTHQPKHPISCSSHQMTHTQSHIRIIRGSFSTRTSIASTWKYRIHKLPHLRKIPLFWTHVGPNPLDISWCYLVAKPRDLQQNQNSSYGSNTVPAQIVYHEEIRYHLRWSGHLTVANQTLDLVVF